MMLLRKRITLQCNGYYSIDDPPGAIASDKAETHGMESRDDGVGAGRGAVVGEMS